MSRDHVLLNKGWRHLQSRRDVVEALRGIVLREDLVRIDVDREKILNRVFILFAVKAVQHHLIVDMRLAGQFVERVLEPRNERIDSLAFGLFGARRRHHASTQFSDGFLEQFRILRDTRGGDTFETDAAGLRFVAVAAGAVFLHHGHV